MAAVPSVAFPFKGSDSASYSGQTVPLVAGGQAAVDTVVQSSAVSRSGTIAAGGTQQTLMAANAARRGFSIQNQSSGPLYFNSVGAATADQNSFLVNPGDYFATDAHHVGTGAISIFGATTGQAFYAREF